MLRFTERSEERPVVSATNLPQDPDHRPTWGSHCRGLGQARLLVPRKVHGGRHPASLAAHRHRSREGKSRIKKQTNADDHRANRCLMFSPSWNQKK